MTSKLISIIGIDSPLKVILKEKGNISTVKQFSDATRTSEARRQLAQKTGIPLANIANWAVQAELLRIEKMSPENAFDLMNAGVYSTSQFKASNPKVILEKLKDQNAMNYITEAVIEKLQVGKVKKATEFDDIGIHEELIAEKTKAPSMYANLSDIIAELGKGIAQAQRALDESAIETQNKILADDRLYSMGLQATWYTMPEAEFTLKMDYMVTEEKNSSGKVLGRSIKAVPSNATYNNYFKSERRESSSVRLRFLPIPMTDRMLERVYMPDLSACKSVQEVIAILEENGITDYRLLPADAIEWGDKTIQHILQSPAANSVITIGAPKPVIAVKA